MSIQLAGSGLFEIFRVELTGGISLAAKVMGQPDMARSEFEGLQAISGAGCRTPNCRGFFESDEGSVLLMDFIEHGSISRRDLLDQLIRLYSSRSESWGWHTNNFIGSLPQPNHLAGDFLSFWISDRVQPQCGLAAQKKLITTAFAAQLENLTERLSIQWKFADFKPRLIHGDLWNGNVLGDRSGKAYLIDPSIAYGHPEQDLAMLQLFGSPLSLSDFEALAGEIGLDKGISERIRFWQIYPLLVHVNLFGGSYVSQLKNAVEYYE